MTIHSIPEAPQLGLVPTCSSRAVVAAVAATALLLLSACATPEPPPPPDPARVALEESLSRVGVSLDFTASADLKAPDPITRGPVLTVSYAGDAAKMLNRIAAAQNKAFVIRGPKPYLPLFIAVESKNVTLEELLADIGSQFGQRADLALTNHSIEIRYRGQ